MIEMEASEDNFKSLMVDGERAGETAKAYFKVNQDVSWEIKRLFFMRCRSCVSAWFSTSELFSFVNKRAHHISYMLM